MDLNPWTFKAVRRGKHGGEGIIFLFQGRKFMQTAWYPPWQNHQQRDNAQVIVEDLNAAFAERNQVGVCEHGVKDGDWCEPCNKAYKAARAENDDG